MKPRSIDDVLDFAERHFEDGIRRFETSMLASADEFGWADVDDIDREVQRQRAEFQCWKRQMRAFLASRPPCV